MVHDNISIIVAIAENFAIGKNNDLLFHLPTDLKHFKSVTSGKTVIMGRNTLLSLPKGALPNRRNIVISDIVGEKFDRCEMASSIEEAIKLSKDDEEAFIIGGGMIYRQFYPMAKRLYLTLVHKSFEADTFFPEVDYNQWNQVSREDFHDETNNFDYSYVNLVRK